jgi:FkbM family methyltransferase
VDALARKYLDSRTVAFDIGANVGLYSLLLSRHCGTVFSFEPWPRNIRYLVETMEINRIKNVIVVPCAVAKECELRGFKAGLDCQTGQLSEKGAQPVATISCDSFVERFSVIPSVIKIDVEGAEWHVLQGADRLLRNHHPALILEIDGQANKSLCLEYLRDCGYNSVMSLRDTIGGDTEEFVVTRSADNQITS